MNGHRKFHKGDGPAFAPGEIWHACDGSGHKVEIIGVRRYGNDKWDISVYYKWTERGEERVHDKDAWNFQVRYYHSADRDL